MGVRTSERSPANATPHASGHRRRWCVGPMTNRHAAPPELSGYEYVRDLGSGGFSDVFLFRQAFPEREVAIKVLVSEGLTDEDREAFVAEANVMARLSTHPYIASILHADVATDGRPYLVMEYYSGPSLAEQCRRRALGVAESARIGIRVASAVATAHQAKILHRDIKPANILTNDIGWPALTDFGIASAVLDEASSPTVMRKAGEGNGRDTSRPVGLSVPWSPVEMFDDVPQPDVRTDVFSLAATIYTLLAGRSPFEVPGARNQSNDLMRRIERDEVTPLERDDVPDSLLAAIRRGMAHARNDRYPTAIDFARALQRVELELGYERTAIDVPNIIVPEPERPAGPSEDETRARGVTTIAAQRPASAPKAASRTPGQPNRANEKTVLRGSVQETAVRTTVEEAEIAPGSPSTGSRRRLGGIVATILGLGVVGAAIAAVATHRGGDDVPSLTPTDEVSGISHVSIAPAPTTPQWTSGTTGSSLTLTWVNPRPENGDTYVWERVDAGGGEKTAVSVPSLTLDNVGSGTTVCVEVWTLRSGRLSVDSLRTCYP